MIEPTHHLLPELDMPGLHHPEVLRLTRQGFDLDAEYMRNLLALPRQTLLEDLISLIEIVAPDRDQILGAFFESGEGHRYQGKTGECAFCFVGHALFFAGELGADEEAGRIFNLLREVDSRPVLYGAEHLWQPFYQLGRKDPDLLLDFAADECDDGFRSCAVEALGQLALQELVWRDKVVAGLQEMLPRFLERRGTETGPDTTYRNDEMVASLAVSVLTHLGIQSALPLIEQVVGERLVDTRICGTVEEIKKQIRKPVSQFWKRNLQDIVALYRGITTVATEVPFSHGESSILNVKTGRPERAYRKPGKQRTVRRKQAGTTPKVGRNDPCPCGSGKKYKKCHGR